MKIGLLPIAAGCFGSLALGVSDAKAQSSCPVAGRYEVIGRNPGAAGSYTGEALITDSGTGCEMYWFPPNESSGSGSFGDGVLTIHFTLANGTGSGVVRYALAGNSELHGIWWVHGHEADQGTETLRPL
jgi:hypothetical protein